MNMTTSLLY